MFILQYVFSVMKKQLGMFTKIAIECFWRETASFSRHLKVWNILLELDNLGKKLGVHINVIVITV